ncbi:MAG: hypothetical protein U0805_01550 [Pirellulales bacterium]
MSDADLHGEHRGEGERHWPRALSHPTPTGDKPASGQSFWHPPLYGHTPTAWLLSWAGITVSGGVFGFLAGILMVIEERESIGLTVLGSVAGIIVAAFFGAPVVVNVAVVGWLFWLSRFHRVMPALAGASTGMISTAMLFYGNRGLIAYEWQVLAIIAGVIGALGGYVPARWYWRKRVSPGALHQGSSGWQFSLGDLFVRFTVASVLLLVWTAIVRWMIASE